MDIAGAILGGLSAATGIGQSLFNAQASEQNYKAQEAQLAYQKQVQDTTWNREDTAIQRRVNDLKAAGLSPTLAAGNAAQTSTPIAVTAPQRSSPDLSAIQAAITQQYDISRTAAQIALTNKQIEIAEAQKQGIQLTNEQQKRDNQFYVEHKIPSTVSPDYKDTVAMVKGFSDKSTFGQSSAAMTMGPLLTLFTKLLPFIMKIKK